MNRAVRLLSIASALVFVAIPASAATIKVTTQGDEFGSGGSKKCALREAIQAANTNAKFGGCVKGKGSDKISLGGGTYKLSIEVDDSTEDANVEGDLDVLSNV